MAGTNRRRRYLLQPMLQIKVGLYHLILGVCFVVTLLGVLHAQWIRFRSWLQLTELRDLIDTACEVEGVFLMYFVPDEEPLPFDIDNFGQASR